MLWEKTFFFYVAEKESKCFCVHQKTIAGAFFVLASEAYVPLEIQFIPVTS